MDRVNGQGNSLSLFQNYEYIFLMKKEILCDFLNICVYIFNNIVIFCCDKGQWIGLMKKEFHRLFQNYYYKFLILLFPLMTRDRE